MLVRAKQAKFSSSKNSTITTALPQKYRPVFCIKAVSFFGTDISGTDYRDSEDITGTIPQQFERGMSFLTRNLHHVQAGQNFNSTGILEVSRIALEELLQNALTHRDYSKNASINLLIFDDRIEIMNHGGLYGRANEENFPNVNDYRNIVVAEAMKVLGFVNRHSRGVLRVQKELIANENGEAAYDFGYQTAVIVCEKKSPLGERMTATAIANGFLSENGEIRSNSVILNQKPPKKPPKKLPKMKVSAFPSKIVEDVFNALKLNPKAKYSWLVDNLGVSERTILRAINDLKELGYINAEHSKIKGVWQFLKQ